MTPLQHRGGSPPTSFILFWKLNTVAVVSWKNGGGGAFESPSSHGNASKLEILLFNTMVFTIFRLLFKMAPTYYPGEVPSFILFWKVDTPSVVPWKGRHTRGRMVTLQMSKDGFLPHILTLWCLAFFPLFSKWPRRLTTYKFHTVLESKHRSGGIMNQKVKRLSDSLPILEETLDTSVLYIMKCWPDMGFVPT